MISLRRFDHIHQSFLEVSTEALDQSSKQNTRYGTRNLTMLMFMFRNTRSNSGRYLVEYSLDYRSLAKVERKDHFLMQT